MSVARKLLVSLAVVGMAATAIAAATWSSFSSTSANPSNSFTAGTVSIGDNDAGGSVLSLSSVRPGGTASGCIRVTYSGSLASAVHLYGSSTGTLAQYLTLTITRGTETAPSFPSCSTFTADSTNYVGSGAGVVYTGSLSSFASGKTNYATGLVDPQSWAGNDSHSYKFTLTLPAGAAAAAQGLSSTAGFTWEAQNS
jgi:predicted ribosomally synthesized peptide with SipW-like signal peptide